MEHIKETEYAQLKMLLEISEHKLTKLEKKVLYKYIIFFYLYMIIYIYVFTGLLKAERSENVLLDIRHTKLTCEEKK